MKKQTTWVAIGTLTVLAATKMSWGQEAGFEVYEALRTNPWARVVVALTPPSNTIVEVDDLSAAVAAIKDRVFFDLDERDFIMSHNWKTISAVAGDLTARGLVTLLSDPNVERIDLDIPGRMAGAESVPLIRADELRSLGVTGVGVVIAVLDTGVDTDHPDLNDHIIAQKCFCANADGSGCCPGGETEASGPGSAEDDHGHGTNVAGIITGGGRVAPVGVAPGAQIVAIRVLDKDGTASGSSQVLSALDWILNSKPGVKIVNMSLVFTNFPGVCDSSASYALAFTQAINALTNRGTIVFASSGNNGLADQIALPACISSAVAVGAVYDSNIGSITFGCTDSRTRADQVACFSNSSTAVDIVAPGGAITAAGIGNGRSTFLGTSQASPHAAAVAALLLQAKPELTPERIRTVLRNSGVPVTDDKSGLTFRRINAHAAWSATQ